ncbi:exopolysaccharide production protein [Novosphingobium sp. Rr 2-17]|uniref:O-antigen ligase family protein n=1 Tax=Novosphingobium sp. Rr 2-17 TaxID=555793 RepID=UPI00026981FC|nr:O-antigen ligase family protein [Novosphingobium sp. Rr 2-17]EIZ79020.1 exopolysaccharide production protein [Novosphingobium sp. Rr 2-17]
MARLKAGGADPILIFAGLLFVVLVLIGPILTFNEGTSGAAQFTGEGSVQRQIGYLVALGLVIYGALRAGRGYKALFVPWPIALALAWCWLSLIWAIDPGVAVRRLTLTTLVVWSTFILIQGASYKQALMLLRVAMLAALIGNYLTVLLDPPVGIHLMLDSQVPTSIVGNWRGFMVHKNFAGAATAICILLFVFDASSIKPWIRASVFAAALFFLYKTQSKTSAGMVVAAMLIGWVYLAFDTSLRRFAVPLLMVIAAVLLLLDSAYQDFAVRNFLNSQAFTGRGYIWSAMLRFASANLVTGAGFGSFWNIGSASPIYDYGQGFVREVTVGHNGYLDLLVTIGLPGLLLVVFAAIIWPTWKLLTGKILPERGALSVALLVFCVGHNMTESSLFERDSLIGVILMAAIAIAQNWHEDERKDNRGDGRDIFAVLRRRASSQS